jgi:hypothetical protein
MLRVSGALLSACCRCGWGWGGWGWGRPCWGCGRFFHVGRFFHDGRFFRDDRFLPDGRFFHDGHFFHSGDFSVSDWDGGRASTATVLSVARGADGKVMLRRAICVLAVEGGADGCRRLSVGVALVPRQWRAHISRRAVSLDVRGSQASSGLGRCIRRSISASSVLGSSDFYRTAWAERGAMSGA